MAGNDDNGADSNGQYNLALVPHRYHGSVISQRAKDGYINATAMCRAQGKLWGHYNESGPNKAFITALASDIGIPISELIQSVKGGDWALFRVLQFLPHSQIASRQPGNGGCGH